MTIIDEIIAKRRAEIEAGTDTGGFIPPQSRTAPLSVFGQKPFIITEVKKKSPSKGIFTGKFNHMESAESYIGQGMKNISVITEKNYFAGSLKYLYEIKQQFPEAAVLRKDFLICENDIEVSYNCGADALLLIASELDKEMLEKLYYLTVEKGIKPLVEIHDEKDLEKVRSFKPALVGINSRDLRDFSVDMISPLLLKSKIDWEADPVYESGIGSRSDAVFAFSAGFKGILTGESVIKNPSLVSEYRDVFFNTEKKEINPDRYFWNRIFCSCNSSRTGSTGNTGSCNVFNKHAAGSSVESSSSDAGSSAESSSVNFSSKAVSNGIVNRGNDSCNGLDSPSNTGSCKVCKNNAEGSNAESSSSDAGSSAENSSVNFNGKAGSNGTVDGGKDSGNNADCTGNASSCKACINNAEGSTAESSSVNFSRKAVSNRIVDGGRDSGNSADCISSSTNSRSNASKTPLVKICGITNREDCVAAAAAGADMIGMVFAESVRKAEITLPEKLSDIDIPKIAVAVNPDKTLMEKLKSFCSRGLIDAVQLSGDESPEFCSELDIPFYKTIRIKDENEYESGERYHSVRMLTDSFSKNSYGGSGRKIDADVLEKICKKAKGRLWLAGGLSPDNVHEIVCRYSPELVDASSSLESSSGKKDIKLMKQFICEAKKSGTD